MRIGGLDVLMDGLRRQTHTDFELILVDALFEQRREIFRDHPQPFRVVHAPPIQNTFPEVAYCHAANTGLAFARGDVVFWISDYTWILPETLRVHAMFHADGRHHGLRSGYQFRQLPTVREELPAWHNGTRATYARQAAWEAEEDLSGHHLTKLSNVETADGWTSDILQEGNDEADAYAALVREGALDPFMWSIFSDPFDVDARTLPEVGPPWVDPQFSDYADKTMWRSGNIFHARGDSIRRSLVTGINGWNEALDGSHGWQDSDLAVRLLMAYGTEWLHIHGIQAQIINPRSRFPQARFARPYETNFVIYRNWIDGVTQNPGAVNDWSLQAANTRVMTERAPTSRLTFQRAHAVGRVVNIGCGDDPARFGPEATHVDIDIWRLPNFVQADCRALPFSAKEFDTAVLGDVLEHCTDPEKAVAEAARVAHRVVITVPEELSLPSVGQHIQAGLRVRADQYRAVYGFDDADDETVIVRQKRRDPRFIGGASETAVPHDSHINRFDDAAIERLIGASGMNVVVYRKIPPCDESENPQWFVMLEDPA